MVKEQTRPLIMLVDDDPHLLRALGDCFDFEGFDVVKATRAEEALDMLDSIDPELIVLDVRMPGLGGRGFLTAVSQRHDVKQPSILIYTAHPEAVPVFSPANVIGILQKPCPHHVLACHVRSAIALQAQSKRPTLCGAQVLLAENDEGFADRMCRLLGLAGHETTVVSDGMAVLEFAASSAPDVIVMKQSLPMMKGSSVAPLISAMPRTRNVPVLVYSEAPPERQSAGRDDRGAPRGILKWVVTKEADDIVNALSEALAAPACRPLTTAETAPSSASREGMSRGRNSTRAWRRPAARYARPS